MAALIVFVPMFIVMIGDNAFSSRYSDIFINTAIAFFIIGKILGAFKNTIENGEIPWPPIGSITVFFIALILNVLKRINS
ncbi:MAG: hypothetical protein AB2421_12245 [Thermotaleaceae bacterium]